MVSYYQFNYGYSNRKQVLILIVVDNGLVLLKRNLYKVSKDCLNPYCSGQWSRTNPKKAGSFFFVCVLILIVVDNGLVQLTILPL